MFVKFCRVKKACMEDGGELERALDDVFGIWVINGTIMLRKANWDKTLQKSLKFSDCRKSIRKQIRPSCRKTFRPHFLCTLSRRRTSMNFAYPVGFQTIPFVSQPVPKAIDIFLDSLPKFLRKTQHSHCCSRRARAVAFSSQVSSHYARNAWDHDFSFRDHIRDDERREFFDSGFPRKPE